jgi:hypothetical protein
MVLLLALVWLGMVATLGVVAFLAAHGDRPAISRGDTTPGVINLEERRRARDAERNIGVKK